MTTTDETGQAWDFDKPECRQKARRLVETQRPLLLIGSPMCTYFSVLRNWFGPKMHPEKLKKELQRARNHLAFMFDLYEIQAKAGRYYLHEHPSGASSWNEPVVVDFIASQPDVILTSSPMCAFGMRAQTRTGKVEDMAYKRTRWSLILPISLGLSL